MTLFTIYTLFPFLIVQYDEPRHPGIDFDTLVDFFVSNWAAEKISHFKSNENYHLS